MKNTSLVFALSAVLNMITVTEAFTQSIPVGSPVLEDYYRRQQLLGEVDSNLSFTSRPLYPLIAFGKANVFDPDGFVNSNGWINTSQIKFANNKGLLQILPVTIQQQYNSKNPYGWNDGAMIPAQGYQTLLSAGIYIKLGPLSIQLRPEYVYAQNGNFQSYESGHGDEDLIIYGRYLGNVIDLPWRFGTGSYKKLSLGQSNISLTVGPIAASLSNENIWWGPGIHNALIVSNNAPGFKHVSLHTVKPIKSYFGSFEGQIIGGKLEASGLTPLPLTVISTGTDLFVSKRNDWRYFTGFNIIYNPKWFSGLSLGLTRTFNAYHNDLSGFSSYVPFFVPYAKQSIIDGDPFDRDQYTSFYSRWLFTKAQAEVYLEYGLNDNSYNVRDFIGSPDHSRAYVFGVRKMLSFKGRTNEHILFGVEVTQLSQSADRLTREAATWYVHSGVRQGHTNMGQSLGAGIGPGGNLQNFNVSWVSGLKKLGFSFERYEHSVDFSRVAFPDIDGNSRKWVDLALGLHGEWNYKNLLLNAKLQHIKSLNYQWILKDYVPGQYYIPNNTTYNLHGELGVSFIF